MSKVQDVINATRETALRGTGYLVEQATHKQSPAHWPPGSTHQPFVAALPQKLQPFVGVEPFSEQIRQVFANYYRFIGQSHSRRTVDRQVEDLAVHYKDLKRLGYEVQDVTTFGLKHAKALLAHWQEKGNASTTIYSRWSFLRTWSRALGKNGMLPSLKELQPDFRRLDQEPHSRILSITQLQARSEYLAAKPDQTAYLVDRLVRELDITREQALEIDFDEVQTVVEGESTVLRVGTGAQRKNVQHIRLHMPLMTEVRDFMQRRNRNSLCWSDLDIEAGLQKYSLRLSYVNRILFPKEKDGQA